MAQPQMAPMACSQCDGWYNSEREMRDFLRLPVTQRSRVRIPSRRPQLLRLAIQERD